MMHIIDSNTSVPVSHNYAKLLLLQWVQLNQFYIKIRGVTIRRATVRYVSRYVGRDTTNDTISYDTPTNLESQTHFS